MKKMVFLFAVAAVICSLGSMAQETPGNSDLQQQLLKARELVMQGNRAEASEICLKIMQSNPHNKMAVQYWIIANMERSQEGEQKMEARLDSLGQHFPGNTGILFFKAFIQAEYGKNEEALATFSKLTNLQPDSCVNFVGTGQILYEMHRYREAEDSFNKAISLDPHRFDLYGMKASALSKQEKYSEAVAALDKGIEVNPAFSVNYYNRACMYSLMGNKTKAMDDLAKAISMNPRFRQSAASDEDFKSLYDDEAFKAMIK